MWAGEAMHSNYFLAVSDTILIYALVILGAILLLALIIILIFALSVYRLTKSPAAEKTEQVERVQQPEAKPFSLEDITDEDMMVAALIATIDYVRQTKKDVRLLSIKQID
jgi:predicted membrane protein